MQCRELLASLMGLAGTVLLPAADATPTYGDLTALRAGLSAVRARFAACRYQAMGAMLPDLITSGRLLAAAGPAGGQRAEVSAVLADAHSMAAFLANKLGDYGLSWVMADRAGTYARASGDVASISAATKEMAVAMRRAGHHATAGALLTSTAAGFATRWPRDLAARGSLLTTAAYTAAQQSDASSALALIAEAGDLAAHLPDTWSADAPFTRGQVAIYRIGVHNALGDHARALTVARTVSLATLPSTERQARVCLDVARSWFGFGDIGKSLRALETAERLAPEETRRPSVRDLVRRLVDAGPTQDALVGLARRSGVELG